MSDTQLLDYLVRQLNAGLGAVNSTSLKLSAKKAEVTGYGLFSMYRMGSGPWAHTVREAIEKYSERYR